jgi:hypothetical protein
VRLPELRNFFGQFAAFARFICSYFGNSPPLCLRSQ